MSQRPVLRSPLKDKTLRNPGQSVDNAIFDVRDSYLDNLVVLVITGSIFAAALLQWFLKVPPLIMVFVAGFYFAATLAFYAPKMFKKPEFGVSLMAKSLSLTHYCHDTNAYYR